MVRTEGLGVDTCWRLLAAQPVGRVGFVADGYPIVLPVNHVVDGHSIVVRTGRHGLLATVGGGQAVAFEVDSTDAFSETGWSVIVSGYASEVRDPTEQAQVSGLPLHPWATGTKDRWIRIVPRLVTGRSISRRRSPDGHLVPYMPAD